MASIDNHTYSLEPSSEQHAQWLYQLYEATMRPVIEEAVGWVDTDQRARFDRSYGINQFQLIKVENSLAGALYTIPEPQHLHLSLILIDSAFRNRSLGTQILRDLQSQQKGLPITLSVFKNNPAVDLYKRLGFRIDTEDDWFLEMSWKPQS